MITTLIVSAYLAVLSGLSVFGILGFITLGYFWRYYGQKPTPPALPDEAELPLVTVQLPLFNERYVVERLLTAVAALDYPRHRLQIQLVDDSTDDTTERAREMIARLQPQGYDVSLLHREDRIGFKAGALAAATAEARGDFMAIFDADFQPQPTFLKETIPYFLGNPRLGMIQTRWGHLNDGSSPLTAAQAIAMDKHFVIEQTVRHRAHFFPKFNGTAGIWRRECVADAGGWQADTVCEDLCLSTRAVLRGWEFLFLPDVVTPGELPTTISAYRNQQARWAKGALQCLLRFGWRIVCDRQHKPMARLYALLAMSAYLAHPCVLALLLLQIPLIMLGYPLPALTVIFSIAGLGQPLLFILSQRVIYQDWRWRVRHLPTLTVLTIGLAPAVTRSLLQIATRKHHLFIRTPKGAAAEKLPRRLDGYRLPFDRIMLTEIGLALYAAVGLALAISRGIWGPTFLLVLCATAFCYITYLDFVELDDKLQT